MPNDNVYKLKKNEILKYQNGNIYKCSDNNGFEAVSSFGADQWRNLKYYYYV